MERLKLKANGRLVYPYIECVSASGLTHFEAVIPDAPTGRYMDRLRLRLQNAEAALASPTCPRELRAILPDQIKSLSKRMAAATASRIKNRISDSEAFKKTLSYVPARR